LGDWMDVVYWQLGEGGWVTEKEHSIFLSFLFSLFFFLGCLPRFPFFPHIKICASIEFDWTNPETHDWICVCVCVCVGSERKNGKKGQSCWQRSQRQRKAVNLSHINTLTQREIPTVYRIYIWIAFNTYRQRLSGPTCDWFSPHRHWHRHTHTQRGTEYIHREAGVADIFPQ